MSLAERRLESGNKFPWDAPDNWWYSKCGTEPVPPAKDWAHSAARGIIKELQDRAPFKYGLEISKVDQNIRAELIAALAEIIRVARINQKES